MKLDTITMDRKQARDSYMAYRAAVRANGGSPEDAMLAKGYRTIALGHSLVDVRAAIIKGGLGNDGCPRIAIARADTTAVKLTMSRKGWDTPEITMRSVAMTKGGTRRGGYPRPPEESYRASLIFTLGLDDFIGQRLPDAIVAADAQAGSLTRIHMRAMTPVIPANLRPAFDLAGYHVLFEAEWQKETPPAPRDPALLKHVGGDLFAVLAVWELTDLERAVLNGTRR